MFTASLFVATFVAGFLVAKFHTQIVAYLVRRAAANKIKGAQKLLDDIEKAKAILASAAPTFPTKPQV